MDKKTRFPFFRWLLRTLTGRWARRTYAVALAVLLLFSVTARVRSYLMARKIHAVLHGLAQLRVDQTTEQELMAVVPHLTRGEDWKILGVVHCGYYVDISNDADWLMRWSITRGPHWARRLAHWLGYRYMGFDAVILVRDGRVVRVQYGLALERVRPRASAYIVSAKSTHGIWTPRGVGFVVTSEEDESPKYRVHQFPMRHYFLPQEDATGLRVTYTHDAPSELIAPAFHLDLSCFWGMRGCYDARALAPQLAADARRIQAATLKRLEAGQCPEELIAGRMRYLPDVWALRLKVKDRRRVEVNEEGERATDEFTDYELKEVIRGRSFGSWENVRTRHLIPLPGDPTRRMANQRWHSLPEPGKEVLFFSNMQFHSCRWIAATPTALALARSMPAPIKRVEDASLGAIQ